MNKFCEKCGNELNEQAVVCLGCGIRLKTTSPENVSDSHDRLANVGFGFGIGSVIAWIIPLFGYPVTIIAIVTSIIGLKSKTDKTKAIVGLVLGCIFLSVTLFNSAIGIIRTIDGIENEAFYENSYNYNTYR